jgi:DNA-binding LacI/PurR family transcriptional regulator
MRVSIKDIARTAGVSHSTVSRALNDSSLISDATRGRIKCLADEMGYSPNTLARSLVTRYTNTVGVVVTTITDPFMSEVVKGIQTTADEYDYTVILCSSEETPEREMAAVEMLRSKRVDGVICIASRIGAVYLEHQERIDAPVVIINNHNERMGRYPHTISVDNHHGGYLAARHLVQQGDRRIAYVSGPVAVNHSSSRDRLGGYHQALMEAGIEPEPALVVEGNGCPDGGERAFRHLAALDELPTAVFCYNDMTAMGLMHAAGRTGLSVPEDLAVVGYDDILLASYLSPPLTTVSQPKVEMGQEAMRIALSLITGDEDILEGMSASSDALVRCRLVVRASTVGRRSSIQQKEIQQ